MSEIPPIDWQLAARTGRRMAKSGPWVSRSEAAETAAALRSAAADALGHATRLSQLPALGASVDVEVMGRARWIEANATSVARMLAPLGDGRPREEWSLAEKVQSRAAGAEAGAVLSVVASRVIGQYDPFAVAPTLYLVAPNVLSVERAMGVVPRDFRLWVCVHEQTHALQFGAAGWLRGYLAGLLADAIRATGVPQPVARRGGRSHPTSVIDVLTTPKQRLVIDRITCVMSVLEGYAEVMMNRVGRDVIVTVDDIRPRFADRRASGGWDALVRRLLALDVKLAQYREGAAFCQAVIDAAGVPALNRVYAGAAWLPDPDELREPRRWMARVLG